MVFEAWALAADVDSLSACLAEIKANQRKFYVYVLSRPDGTPFYVGKGQRRRIAHHHVYAKLERRGHRYSVIRKIWREEKEVRYQIVSFYETEREAIDAEIALIAKIGLMVNDGPLVNQTDGGDGVSGLTYERTPEHRAKLSATSKGRKKSPEAIAAVVAARRGYKHSPETRAKISVAVRSPEAVAKIAAARVGFRHSAESIEKNRLAHLGKKASPETRAKMSASRKGRKPTEETRAKLRAAHLRRRPMSDETKAKISATLKSRGPLPAEAKVKMSESMRKLRADRGDTWGKRRAAS